MCRAAISAIPIAAMNAMRTEVRMRPGLGLSSSVTSCCNQAASVWRRRNAVESRHPEGRGERSLLLAVVGSTVPPDHEHENRDKELEERMDRFGFCRHFVPHSPLAFLDA